MAGIAQVLKEEIKRISKKETLRLNSELKSEVSRLKKEIEKLKVVIAEVVVSDMAAETQDENDVQLTGKEVRRLRAKMKLSQAALSVELGVSTQSIYNWEKRRGVIRFRGTTKRALAKLIKNGPQKSEAASKNRGVASSGIQYTGEDIKKIRVDLGLSQASLGEELKVSVQSIYNWEKNNNPIRFRGTTKRALLRLLKNGPRNSVMNGNVKNGKGKIVSRMNYNGKGIKKLRTEMNLTQQELAKKLGVSTQSVYNWEKSRGSIRFRGTTSEMLARLVNNGVATVKPGKETAKNKKRSKSKLTAKKK